MSHDRYDYGATRDDDIDISSRLARRSPFRPHAVATSCGRVRCGVVKGLGLAHRDEFRCIIQVKKTAVAHDGYPSVRSNRTRDEAALRDSEVDVTAIRASHVAIAQMGEVNGQQVHMNSVDGRNVTVTLKPQSLVVEGGGLSEEYPLSEVLRVGATPDGSRFGLMAPGSVTGFLVEQAGLHMVRIDAKAFGGPKKSELKAFGDAVVSAVRAAGGSA